MTHALALIYRYLLFLVLFLNVVVLLFFRDLAEKPIVDVLIPSISSILAACVAAFVALKVADYQIAHNENKEKETKASKLISRIKLLKKEVAYNENQLKLCLDRYTPEVEPQIAEVISSNVKSELWDILAVEIIEDLDDSLFDELTELYYKISRLKQPNTFELSFCNSTFSECSAVNSKIDTLLKSPTLLINSTKR